MTEATTQNLTPEESATLTRAANAVGAGLYVQPSETETLVKLCERLSSAVGVAERDAQDARAELARLTGPLDKLSPGVTAELRRGWRFSAEAAMSLIQQGKADLDPRPLLECFIYSLDALDRLSLELQKRDEFLTSIEARLGAVAAIDAVHPAFNSDETPPDFRPLEPAPVAEAAPAREPFDWSSEPSELDTRAASPGAGEL